MATNTSSKSDKSGLPICNVTALPTGLAHSYKLIYSSFLLEYERSKECSEVQFANISKAKQCLFSDLRPLYDLCLKQYSNPDESWAYIVSEEDEAHGRIREVFKEYYRGSSRASMASITENLHLYTLQIVKFDIDNVPKLARANVKSRVKGLNFRISKNMHLGGVVLAALHFSRDSKDVKYLMRLLNAFLTELHGSEWVEVAVFRRFMMRICSDFVFRDTLKFKPEGLLESIGSSMMPNEVGALVNEIRNTNIKFGSFMDSIQSKIDQLGSTFSAAISKIFGDGASLSAIYSERGFGDLVPQITAALLVFFDGIGASLQCLDVGRLGDFLSSLFGLVLRTFDAMIQKHIGSKPMFIRIMLLAIATSLFLEVDESSVLYRAVLAGIVGYLASTIFLSIKAHRKIVPAIIRALTSLLDNKGYVLSFVSALAVLLKEVCGVEFGTHGVRLLNLIARAPRYFSGIVSCVGFVGAAWNKLIFSYVEENPDLEAFVLYDKTDALYREAHEHVVAIQETLARYPVTDSVAVAILEGEYNKLEKLICAKYPKELGPYHVMIQQVLHRAKTYLVNAQRFGVNLKGPRQEPVCVLIRGDPGSMKSTFCAYVNAILQQCIKGEVESYEAMVKDTYSVNVNSDYWDGYHNQSVVVMDDFMQVRESVGDATSSSKVIEMVNSMPTPLNMAHLDSKGAVYFTSQAVILTTNIKQVTSEAIESPEALARRIHVYLEISVKEEYKSDGKGLLKNGSVDPEKVLKGPRGELLAPSDMWRITLYRGNDKVGMPTDPVEIDFEELTKIIQKNYNLKKRIFRSLELNLSLFMQDMNVSGSRFSIDEYDEKYLNSGEDQVLDIRSLDDIQSDRLRPVVNFFSSELISDARVRSICRSAGLDVDSTMSVLYQTLMDFDRTLARSTYNGPVAGISIELLHFCAKVVDPSYLRWVEAQQRPRDESIVPTCVGFYAQQSLNNVTMLDLYFSRGLDIYTKKWCPPFLLYVKESPWSIVGGTSALVMAFFLIKGLRRLWCSKTERIQQDELCLALEEDRLDHSEEGFVISAVPVVESSVKSKARVTKPKTKPVPVKVVNQLQPEGDMPLSSVALSHMQVIEKVQRNMCAIMLASRDLGPLKVLSNAIFVNDRVVMFNKHILDIVDCVARKKGGVYASCPSLCICFTKPCSMEDFGADDDNSAFANCIIGNKMIDLEVFFDSGRQWGQVTGEDDIILLPFAANAQYKTIVHLFLSEAEEAKMSRVSAGIIAARKGTNNVVTNVSLVFVSDTSVANFDGYGFINMRKCLQYTYSLGPGSCGSPVFMISSGVPKVAGIHSAGAVGMSRDIIARAVCVTSDAIKVWLATLDMKPEADIETLPFRSERNYGPMAPSVQVSSIVPTELNHMNRVLVTKSPARLRQFTSPEFGVVNPFFKAYSRYGCGEFKPDKDVFESAVSALQAELEFILLQDKFSVHELELEHSIHSVIIDGDVIPSIARGTSVGYPYNATLCKTKKTLWGEDGEFDFTSSQWLELRRILERQDLQLRAGERPEFFFQDCLKDETLPIEKVKEGRTRMFSACPVDYLVLFRRYYIPFCAWLVRNRLKYPSTVGINPTSAEWDGLVQYLCASTQPNKANFLDGDFSRFDASQKVEVFQAIFRIIDKLYEKAGECDPARQLARATLWKEVYSSVHVFADRKVFWDGALPSGHPMTSLINSLYNSLAFNYAWLRACRDKGFALCSSPPFSQNVRLAVFGDDNIIGVSDRAKDIFEASSIGVYMSELGLTYTAVAKDSLHQEYKPLDQCSFLKRAFRLEPTLGNSWVAPLNLESLVNSLMWRKKTFPEIDHYRFVGETFLNELALHDQETYDKWSVWLVDNFLKLGVITRRVELDRYLRLRHVMSDFENLYEYTDSFVERYMALKRGARLFEQDDLLRLEGVDVSQFECLDNSTKPLMNMEYILSCIDDIAHTCVDGNGNSHPFSTHGVILRPEADGVDTSRVVETNVTTTSITTESVPADSQHGPTASFVSADSTMLTEVLAKDIPIDFEESQSMGVHQTLEDFFAKPVLRYTSSFTTSDGPASVFPAIWLPYDAQQVDMWKDKLKGFMSMKFDVVIRLQVNSTRFQQGRYILYFVPYAGGGTGSVGTASVMSVADAWLTMHSANTTCITQLPHVEIDIATQSEVVLRIPYINVDPFTPILPSVMAPGVWGSVSIFPYSKLVATAGSTDASYSLWYSLENVKLYTPTIPQGDIEARERRDNGPISSGLKIAAKATSVLGRIPILKAVAGPTSFFLDVASDVARVFGWSRPLDTAKAERRLIAAAPYACNFDSPAFGMPLTNCVDTSVGTLPNFAGSELDEMTLTSFVTRYSYLARYNWSNSALAKDNLAHIGVYPWGAYRTITHSSPSLTYIQHTGPSFVANMFRFWRGSMKYKFKLVKTEFHSGRLIITFVPFDYRQTPPSTTGLTTDMERYAAKTIIDISSVIEFEIVVPFISNTPWAEYNTAIGFLDVFVLDPLKAPNTVSSSVTILLEVAMCPDAQFNEYHSENIRTPFVPAFRYEGADVVPAVASSNIIGGGGSVVNSDNAAQYCMGDMILSFRSLIKRPHYILMTDAARTGLPGVVSQTAGYQTFCAPYRVSIACCATVAGVDTLVFPSTGANDLYSLLSCCFALSRGSLVCEIHAPPTTANVNTIIVRKNFNTIVGPGVSNSLMRAAAACGNTGNGSYSAYNGMRNGSGPLIAYNVPNGAHFQTKCDCYNRSFSRPVYSLFACDNSNLQFIPYETSAASYAPAVVICASTAVQSVYSWTRFGGDDFSLGYFVSIPPVLDIPDIAQDLSY